MGNDETLISIIMPSLNVKPFIEKCICSVINQTLNEIEIICVDAGSTDGTLEIIEQYAKKDSRIRIYHSDKKSYGYQMNLGISKANGKYIGIVETDDFIDEKMYETLYGLTKGGEMDIARVSFYHFFDESFIRKDYSKKDLSEIPFTVYDDAYILRGHPSIWAAIYKKSFLDENNISFMEVPGGGWVDNPFLFETSLCAKSIIYKDEPFYYYRELNPSSSTNDLKDLTLPMARMMDNLDVLEKYSCDDENILTESYVIIFWHIQELLNHKNFKQHENEVFKGFYDVLKRVDEDIVKKRFGPEDQKLYYKYGSPLNLINLNEDSSMKFNKSDFIDIINEENFLSKRVETLENEKNELIKITDNFIKETNSIKNEITSLKNKNKKLKKENKNLKKRISEFKSRKVIKLVDKFKN